MTSSYPRFEGDGAGTFVQSLCEAYIHLGHQVTVIAPHDALERSFSSLVPVHRFWYAPAAMTLMGHGRSLYADVRLKRLIPLLIPSYSVAAVAQLVKCCQKEQFDWLHVHWLVPSGILSALSRILGTPPFIITLLGSDVYLAERLRLLGGLVRVTLKQAGAVCAVSSDLALRCARLGTTSLPIHLIPNGVDAKRFQPRLSETISTSLDSRTPRSQSVLAVGRLVHKKGFDVLIRAFARVVKAVPSARLSIAGDGDLRAELQQLTHDVGLDTIVDWLGHVAWDRIADYQAASDVYVFSGVRDTAGNVDGLPVSLLEAMACGRPVIASRVGGVPEALCDGVEGLLVEPDDEEQLAAAIVTILKNQGLAKQLGQNARQRIMSEFTWERIATRYVALAKSLGFERQSIV